MAADSRTSRRPACHCRRDGGRWRQGAGGADGSIRKGTYGVEVPLEHGPYQRQLIRNAVERCGRAVKSGSDGVQGGDDIGEGRRPVRAAAEAGSL